MVCLARNSMAKAKDAVVDEEVVAPQEETPVEEEAIPTEEDTIIPVENVENEDVESVSEISLEPVAAVAQPRDAAF